MKKILSMFITVLLSQVSFAGGYGPIYGVVLTQRGSYLSVLIKKSYKNCRGVRTFEVPPNFKKLNLKGKFISFKINSEICNDNSKIVSVRVISQLNLPFSQMANRLKVRIRREVR